MKLLLIKLFVSFNTIVFVQCQLCMLLNSTNVDKIWDDYKNKYEKNYQGILEKRRKGTWLQNCKKVRKHNEEAKNGKYNFTLSSNRLADMVAIFRALLLEGMFREWEEFINACQTLRRYHNRMIKLTQSYTRKIDMESVGSMHFDFTNLPEEIDWRTKGFVTPPYNQKDCGACYAFSISHTIQAQIYKQTSINEPLSEQQIVDCSMSMGNHGCAGGSLRNTLMYLENTGGLMAAKDYPYIAKQGFCKFRKNKVMVNVTSWTVLPPRNELTMKALVANVGPIAASINASPHTFQLYKSGVYDDIACSSSVVNHAMLIVGYTKDAWIMKNWWGSKWGEDGYMQLRRNRNQCGVSNYVAYVIV